MIISLQLIKGDVRDVEGIDRLLFGRRCPLRAIVTEETREPFCRQRQWYSGIEYPYEVLHAYNYRWNTVLSVDFRSHNKLTTMQFLRIYLSLLYVLSRKRQSGSIAIMPFSARNPEYVALGTIYALWLAAHNRSEYWGSQQSRRDKLQFKIISDDGIEPYEAVLANRCKRMWEFLDSVFRRQDVLPWYVRHFSLRRLDAEETIHFAVEKLEV